jgi:two-component system, chemotaxis family, sensor kinase CheA
MQIEDDEILQGFIEESLEHLADIETDLLAIEKAGANIDENLVNKVFRAAHSIKGGAGFMGLTVIQELSHAMENILGMIRSRKLVPNPEIVNVLLQGSDKLEFMINNIQTSNEEDITEHLIPLNAIAEGNSVQAAPPPTPSMPEPVAAEPVVQEAAIIVQDIPVQQSVPTPVAPQPEPASYSASVPSMPLSVNPSSTETSPGSPIKADTSLRVHVSLLDSLMTLAGELVLSRNQLLQTISTNDLRNAEAVGQRIDLITSELQEAIMLTRMQPIGNVFSKFPRVVRDLSKQLNKTIDLTIVGNEVELDKTIIESINDPLTHLIRNSVDHGVEMPADRKRAGKPEKGLIVLKAYHEAGQVVIQISDDGKGLDGEALAASAISKGLISVEQAQIMSDKERINLIFLPGFSMAKKVTDVSGRGVGMDVVKTNLDKLGGQVEIVSEVGKGTTISIKLPLTLAIIPCQIITTSGERYAIPQVNLEELLRIPANQVKKRVEKVGNAEVVRLRGNLLPLIRLSDVIEAERSYWDPTEEERKTDRRDSIADRRGKHSPFFQNTDKKPEENQNMDNDNRAATDRRYSTASALNIVVVSTNAMKYGLIVDRLQDSEEIVIKPLGRHLQQCKGYAGATIMGDGRIALILDVTNLARMAHLTSIDGTDRANEVALAAEELIRTQKDRQALLIFRSSEHEQFAVPLNQVERIEKINRSEIENMGGKRVMQYRGGSLALFTVDDISTVHPLADHDDLLVIVFNICSKPIGLLAIGPIDAVEISSEIDGLTLKQPGIMGSIIIDGQTTMLIDVFEIVQTLFPDWFAEKPVFEVDKVSGITPTILIAEDSNFFRNQVKGYMTESGYNVLEGADGAIAWDLLQKHADEISMVVTDIEMPNMNGFELTEIIRKNPSYNKIPIIALTTLAADEDIAKGKAVGIDEYHIKLDKEKLMACVHDYIKRLY